MDAVYYHTPEGKINGMAMYPPVGEMVDLALGGAGPGESLLWGAPVPGPLTDYCVHRGAVSKRPAMAPTVRTTGDGILLQDLPRPCAVTVDGHPYEVPDGELALAVPFRGMIRVHVRAWPYMDFECSVEARGE